MKIIRIYKKTAITAVIVSTAFITVLLLSALGVINTGSDRNTLIISTSSATAVYSGKPLTSAGWKLEAGELPDSYSLDVNVFGSQTEAGQSDNRADTVIRDKHGADVTYQFSISYVYGTLNVIPLKLTVKTGDRDKIYDGSVLSCDEWYIANGELPDGFRAEAILTGGITNVGEMKNTVTTMTVLNSEGMDVTSNFSFTYDCGILAVNPVKITVETGSASKTYDGERLYCADWKLLEGSLLKGHTLSVSLYAFAEQVGQYLNTASSAAVKDEDGNDVTMNYQISYVYGTLSIIAP